MRRIVFGALMFTFGLACNARLTAGTSDDRLRLLCANVRAESEIFRAIFANKEKELADLPLIELTSKPSDIHSLVAREITRVENRAVAEALSQVSSIFCTSVIRTVDGLQPRTE